MEQSELTNSLETLSPQAAAFNRLCELAFTLRSENGCPWDKAQTPLSMRPNLMEETFEAIDAITEENPSHAKEELGDMLFNTVLTAAMYQQEGHWTVAQCVNQVCDKLVRRHPHVFGSLSGAEAAALSSPSQSPAQLKSQWDAIKEKVEGRASKSALDGIPQSFPPLLKALKTLKKAAKAGGLGESPEEVLLKIQEKLALLQKNADRPASSSNTAHLSSSIEDSIGELLLSVVDYARLSGVDPSIALHRATGRFQKEFRAAEGI